MKIALVSYVPAVPTRKQKMNLPAQLLPICRIFQIVISKSKKIHMLYALEKNYLNLMMNVLVFTPECFSCIFCHKVILYSTATNIFFFCSFPRRVRRAIPYFLIHNSSWSKLIDYLWKKGTNLWMLAHCTIKILVAQMSKSFFEMEIFLRGLYVAL